MKKWTTLFEKLLLKTKKEVKKKAVEVKMKNTCNKGEHPWNYFTWGNAFVDNLDNTFSPYDIGSRTCPLCKKHELHLKNGWEPNKKEITIHDLFDVKKETV